MANSTRYASLPYGSPASAMDLKDRLKNDFGKAFEAGT